MADFLARGVAARLNILISGATASGKTTTLNALSAAIVPNTERIVTIEDAAELCLQHEHVVSLETRPPNVEGNGATTMRDLLRNALRMRPDRIIVGEVRGPEAFDMLHAMMTGHDGSLSTVHGNNSVDALVRIENMVLMAGEGLPVSVARYQVANAIDLVVHQVRFADGRRRVMEIAAVAGYRASGEELDKQPYQLWPLFRYQNCVGQAEKESFCLLADGPPPQRLQEKLASRGAGDLFL
jgi:pilus assembly protein CpaF